MRYFLLYSRLDIDSCGLLHKTKKKNYGMNGNPIIIPFIYPIRKTLVIFKPDENSYRKKIKNNEV
jgi:hypothetical protein